MGQENKQHRDFTSFLRAIKQRVSTTENSYKKRYSTSNAVRKEFSLEQIQEIIQAGDLESIRDLSRCYYRISGIYRGVINLMANFSLYQTVVTPLFDPNRKNNKNEIIKSFNRACKFVEALNVPVTFSTITEELLLNGIYYGLLRREGDKCVIQKLPSKYCRTRFQDFSGLNIIEFNIAYFDTIDDKALREESLKTYPSLVQKAYRSEGKRQKENWIEIYPEQGAICFFTGDKTPLFLTAIPEIKKLEAAVDREAERDQNELYKLLIQKMPIDNKGELVFPLEEVADIHSSVADMLSDTETVDVLTTFGDTSLESLQDTTAASQSSNRIEKYKNNAYDNLGVSSLYFNPSTSSAMPYMIAKDEAWVNNLNNHYSAWIKAMINQLFSRPGLSFDFTILPTTRYNRKEVQSSFFQGAQYGYSKIYAGVAMGIPQANIISLMEFENEMLGMDEKMVPLMSSYTSSSKDIAEAKKSNSEETTVGKAEIKDITNRGGRPQMSDTERSEKTVQNNDAM